MMTARISLGVYTQIVCWDVAKMSAQLSPYCQERIIVLWNGGHNISYIVQTMHAGQLSTHDTVCQWGWEQNCGLQDNSCSGEPSKITNVVKSHCYVIC